MIFGSHAWNGEHVPAQLATLTLALDNSYTVLIKYIQVLITNKNIIAEKNMEKGQEKNKRKRKKIEIPCQLDNNESVMFNIVRTARLYKISWADQISHGC